MTAMVDVRRDDHVALVTLNRPEALNAISGAMADEMAEVFGSISKENDVWVVILQAAGDKAFCVGADLKERAGFSLGDFYANRAQVRAMFEAVRATPQPVVAAVFGFALGGGFELALSCDLVLAAEGTQLGLPEARMGLLPAGGGTQLLTRKLGTSRAKELIYRGRRIDAVEAEELGLVAEVVARDDLDAAALALARDICRSSPVAVQAAKRSIEAAFGSLETGLEQENEAWKTVIASEDRAEGITAFNDKREPVWRNR